MKTRIIILFLISCNLVWAYGAPINHTGQADVPTINMVTFGADNTGKVDCSALVRKAQEQGNIYFPAGTYLMSAVDVISDRKYYGDGMGKTTIKANIDGPKTVFCISTYDFDKSKHPKRNVENVQISDLTIDFNFTAVDWVDFFCPILFKGRPGNLIRNINIDKVGFIDSGKKIHPDAIGGAGKDAWCMSLSSYCDSTTDITIQNCNSTAQSHQFVAGGGGGILKRVKVLNNYILAPHANGIAFTTVSNDNVTFDDFEVSGNTIEDAEGSSVLFGHDPSPNKRAISSQIFSRLKVTNNTIIVGDYNVYGTSYRKKRSFPFIFNISGSEPNMSNILIKDNNITIRDNYSGGEIYFFKMQTYTYNRLPTTITGAFVQPEANRSVTITVASDLHLDKEAFQKDGYIAISNAGVYKILAANGNHIDVALATDLGSSAPAASTISAGNSVNFLGGKLSNVRFIDNKVVGKTQLKTSISGVIDTLIFSGNNKVSFNMAYESSLIKNVVIENNDNFNFKKTAGYFNGIVRKNIAAPSAKNTSPINVVNKVSKLTNLQEKTNITP